MACQTLIFSRKVEIQHEKKRERQKVGGGIYIYIKELETWSKSSTQPVHVSEREPGENARIEAIIETIEENLPKLIRWIFRLKEDTERLAG